MFISPFDLVYIGPSVSRIQLNKSAANPFSASVNSAICYLTDAFLDLWLPMPVMTLMLLAPVFPFGLSALNFSPGYGNDARCQMLESLEWSFRFLAVRALHAPNISSHRLDRKTYRSGAVRQRSQ